jgi:hypothetical protein
MWQHGTRSGYQSGCQDGDNEGPCDACRAANAEYIRRRRSRQRSPRRVFASDSQAGPQLVRMGLTAPESPPRQLAAWEVMAAGGPAAAALTVTARGWASRSVRPHGAAVLAMAHVPSPNIGPVESYSVALRRWISGQSDRPPVLMP